MNDPLAGKRKHKLLTDEDEKRLPKLYSTEDTDLNDKVLQLKFFSPYSSWSWYVVEFDGEDLFFGLVDGWEKEWGYFSHAELSTLEIEIGGALVPGVERDLHWTPITYARFKE